MKQKLIKEELIVKNIKQLKLELKKAIEKFNLKKAKFKVKCADFTLLVRYEDGQLKFKNTSNKYWNGLKTDKDWAEAKRFAIYLVKH